MTKSRNVLCTLNGETGILYGMGVAARNHWTYIIPVFAGKRAIKGWMRVMTNSAPHRPEGADGFGVSSFN